MPKLLIKRSEPNQFMLWCGISTISLTFLVITMLCAFSKDEVGWVHFHLPTIFGLSTFLILASSYTIHQANYAFKKEDFFAYRYLLGTTAILGFSFMVTQYLGWQEMYDKKLPLINAKRSVAYLYLLSGLHIAHLLGGMVALFMIFIKASRKTNYIDSFIYAVNPPNQLRLKLITIYWHFVDILWVYLYLFLSYHYK